jgi:predicted house-cleaning noncanonical NTP pyrophosphatase (MazG superfamily)
MVRKEVEKFSMEMEKVLKENDYKGGWKDCSDEYLHNKLLEEVAEYFQAVGEDAVGIIRDFANQLICADNEVAELKEHKMLDQQKELVDIANICMMLHGNKG